MHLNLYLHLFSILREIRSNISIDPNLTLCPL